MSDFLYRTEDIKPDELQKYFVETQQDRRIIDVLKARNPAILVGSRGVGKSFLLKVAQRELLDAFEEQRVFPVYLSFVRSSLLHSGDEQQFHHWMLARICGAIIRGLHKAGLLAAIPQGINLLAGGVVDTQLGPTKIEHIAEQYEDSWRNPKQPVNTDGLPSIDELKEAIEDLTDALNIDRVVLLVDEAAHIFLPEQQRQFFTLFRDLRSHCLTCNAAVYPGVTSFGDTFQPAHDATMLSIDRDVLAPDYVANMREIVEKQADSSFQKTITQYGKNFAILAYAASGNPRILLKTLAKAPKLNGTQVNEVVREYYRTEIWAEHSSLAEKYLGHRKLIDWGRHFIENYVLPDLKKKNDQYLNSERNTSAFIWIHRDTPETVKEALRVLSYTGIVSEHAPGIKATRGEIGKRYIVNLGCLFALESAPTTTAFEIAKVLTPKRMTEFGANHPAYSELKEGEELADVDGGNDALAAQLAKPIDVLDLTNWQKEKLLELKLDTVRHVLEASEEKLKEATYVGDVRARRMRNAAIAAVLEYLSG
ncbi:hypothetical protein FP568_09510 [Pandoraea pnomenusa]|uniref:ORC-CDC6 family AAA ATPase n=1 Tax=Pandoraea pnomenusa TaxID=93220 RepID=UPI001198CA1D|nr:hypothetical protein [Pandoraea pnomenusa]QDX21464.1 hypothetical protein FP568_09510 [Pandoraea pnomenusa]